jgi:anti-sigma factor ChrR (cupin superfamily)
LVGKTPNNVNNIDNDERLPPALLDELLDGLAPIMPAAAEVASLRGRVMASLKDAPQESSELSLAIAALRDLAPLAEQQWEERWPGVELCTLRETADSRAYLMRMRPGSTLPAHIHSQDEVSMIVEGEAWVGDGQLMGPGDFQFMPAGVDHATIRSPGGCIAFIHGQHGFRPRITVGFVARYIQYAVQRWSR